MLIIISPAKSFSKEIKAPAIEYTQPALIDESKKLMAKLKGLSMKKLAELMKLSDELTQLNTERHQKWKAPFSIANADPALFAFTGEVYRGLDAKSLSNSDLKYAQEHLRILSGLYGSLRPLDLIQPYRLEMGTKLKYYKHNNLYQFWGDAITDEVNAALGKDEVLVNLASNEYFKALNKKKLKGKIITPVFKDFSNGQYKILMTYAKNARGMMTRFIIQERIEEVELLKAFEGGGYYYSPDMSDENTYTFLRG
ncbi:MAG: peroxide stress protein YaaA [Bacteroidota bacterium]